MYAYIHERNQRRYFISLDANTKTMVLRKRVMFLDNISKQIQLFQTFLSHFYQNMLITERKNIEKLDINKKLQNIVFKKIWTENQYVKLTKKKTKMILLRKVVNLTDLNTQENYLAEFYEQLNENLPETQKKEIFRKISENVNGNFQKMQNRYSKILNEGD